MSGGRRPVIYVITNTVNGKQYVGQTRCGIMERWRKHWRRAESGKGACQAIAAAIMKYGNDAFTIDVVIELPGNATQSVIDEAEKQVIREMSTLSPNGYNLSEGGKGGRPSEAACARMSFARKGKKLSEEHRQKLSEAHRGRKRTSESQIAAYKKLAEQRKGKPRPPEVIAKMAQSQKKRAKSPTPAMKLKLEKMHEAVRGRVQSPDERARRSASLTAHYAKHPRSAETCRKLSEVQKGRVFSEETRRKMSEARKRYLECQMDSQKISV